MPVGNIVGRQQGSGCSMVERISTATANYWLAGLFR
jgi:hypothetical protein